MRHANADGFAGLLFPVSDEQRIDVAIEFAGGIIRDVEQVRLRSCGSRPEHNRRGTGETSETVAGTYPMTCCHRRIPSKEELVGATPPASSDFVPVGTNTSTVSLQNRSKHFRKGRSRKCLFQISDGWRQLRAAPPLRPVVNRCAASSWQKSPYSYGAIPCPSGNALPSWQPVEVEEGRARTADPAANSGRKVMTTRTRSVGTLSMSGSSNSRVGGALQCTSAHTISTGCPVASPSTCAKSALRSSPLAFVG
jgi:hypothetical protein